MMKVPRFGGYIMMCLIYFGTVSSDMTGIKCDVIPYASDRKVTPMGNCHNPPDATNDTNFHTGGLNKCYSTGGIIVDYKCIANEQVVTYPTCSYEIICPNGKFLNEKGVCALSVSDCYYEDGLEVPKDILLPQSKCTDADWQKLFPKHCAIKETKAGCSTVGTEVKVPFVILPNGTKLHLEGLSIERAQVKSEGDAVLIDKRYKAPGSISGTLEYCKHLQPTMKPEWCHLEASVSSKQYRILDMSSLIPFVHVGDCKSAVRGYGVDELMVFGIKEAEVSTECPKCSMECEDEELKLTIDEPGEKIIRTCGRTGCGITETADRMIMIPRTFHERISDEQVKATVYDVSKTYTYTLVARCEKEEICAAIDCHFCYIRFINVACYSWYHYVAIILILYAILIVISLTISLLKPFIKLLYGLAKIFIKLLIKLTRACAGKSKKSMENLKNYADEEAAIPLKTRNPIYNPGRARATKSGIQPFFGLIMIVGLGLNQCVAYAPCSNSVMDNIKIESCKKVNDRLECMQASLVDVPMISYDQTSCLHFRGPKGDTIGEVQITPMDLHFRCVKVHEFWTRDVLFTSDHLVHCPHAAECNEGWCASINKASKIEGLPEVQYPIEQFCKLGDACWGEGCFYCTHSCHVVRYYPKPINDKVYEVFTCSKWEPSGTFRVLWRSQKSSGETTLSFIHGQSKEVTPGLSLTLSFTVQTKYPILSKAFLTDGTRTALLSSSPLAQPIPGTVGAVQCASKNGALLMRDCIFAPNSCVCSPNGGNDGCDCSQINLEAGFKQGGTLPTHLGTDYLETQRDEVFLKTAALGTASMRVRSLMPLVGITEDMPECKIEVQPFTGCHTCISGATSKYTCRSITPFLAIVECESGITLQLNCDDKYTTRDVRAQFSSPLIDMKCSASCSKEKVFLSGTLKSTGIIPMNNGSHTSLVPAESTSGWGSWLSDVWFSMGWFNLVWIVFFVCVILIVIFFMWSCLDAAKVKYKAI